MEFLWKLLIYIFDIAKIVMPLMIVMEILKDLNLIDKINSLFQPLLRILNIEAKAGLAMGIGILFGLLYGAGAILKSVEEDNLDKKTIILVGIFLSLCHAVIEDSIIFMAIGASAVAVFMSRLLTAFCFTFLASKFVTRIKFNDEKAVAITDEQQ